jgi:hypothetical protein
MELRSACAALPFFTATALAQIGPQRAEGPRKHTPTPTSAAISVEDVRTRVYIIADDSMEGRRSGRRGGFKGAQYIANELKRLGLEPAGDNGSFLQAIPYVLQEPDPRNALSTGGVQFVANTDFMPVPRIGYAIAIGGQPFGRRFRGSNVASVYGGRIGDSTMISSDAARGKVVVFAQPSPGAGARGGSRGRGGRGGGGGGNGRGGGIQFWQRDNLRRYREASALLVVTPDLTTPQLNQYRAAREAYDDSTATGDATPLPVIFVTPAVAERILGASPDALSPGAPGMPVTGNVGFVNKPTEAPTHNVIGIIRGSDPRLRNTYVVVGAHHDHDGIGRPVDHDSIRAFNRVVRPRGADDPPPQAGRITPEQWTEIRRIIDSLHTLHGGPGMDSIFNGADDDGSGSVLALEMAEALARAPQKPSRSVVFVFHAAEERGLLGALYYSDHMTVPRDSIVAMINMDQMGRGDAEDAPTGGPNSLVVIGSRRLSTELGDLAERVNAKPGHSFRLDYGYDQNGDPLNAYCRSDHYMYARWGIPVAFFSAAATYQDYHMVSDEPRYVAFERMTKVGRYIFDYMLTLANLDHRPLVDKPAPDPNGRCQQ